MKVLYITYENVYRTGILQAMVIKPLAIMHKKYGVDFLITSTVKSYEVDDIYEINKKNTIERYPYLEIVEFNKNLTKSQSVITYFRDVLPIFIWSLKHSKKVDLIHCRSYGAGLVGLFLKLLKKKRFIFDMRGVLPEETVEVGKITKNSFKYRLLKIIEKYLIKYSDYVFVVSTKFEKYIQHNFQYKNILNTYNQTDFLEYPTLKKYDRINFVYSGSLQPWHLPETTIKYYYELSKQYKSRIHLYFCTDDIQKAKKYFEEFNIDQQCYTIQSIPFDGMKEIYEKAHIGFCFINESFSKSVCFPVKFSEYIASNIYALVNKNVGDLENIVRENDCGLVFDNLEDLPTNIEKIKQLINNLIEDHINYDRSKISYLDWNATGTEKIYDTYKLLCHSKKHHFYSKAHLEMHTLKNN